MISTRFMAMAAGLLLPATGFAANFFTAGESSSAIKDQYVVIYKKGVNNFANFLDQKEENINSRENTEIIANYRSSLNGFAVKTDEKGLEQILEDPMVAYVEQDQIFKASSIQSQAVWGLDRIDTRDSLDSSYEYNMTGAGVHAYIIDTGINENHDEFESRIAKGFSSIGDSYDDCNGHGTHVAGTVAGKTYGVAKEALIHPVKVLNCSGNGRLSGVLEGIEWVADNAEFPAVANMSLGGGKSRAIDDAVESMIDAGVSVVVAAGNENQNACNVSPANVSRAITVAASDIKDKRASFSNYGKCVDLFAPGVDIKSAWIGYSDSLKTISGTSMASPHVAGVVALFLENSPNLSPREMEKKIVDLSTFGEINDTKRSPNKLVFTDPTELGPENRSNN